MVVARVRNIAGLGGQRRLDDVQVTGNRVNGLTRVAAHVLVSIQDFAASDIGVPAEAHHHFARVLRRSDKSSD